MSSLCTIGELSDRVGRVLSMTGADHQRSGRIKAVPDIRTLRFYTTRGLLAPPEEIRGRTAFYGRRHLVQAVAIKRLQSDGESLEKIQYRVVGATDAQLEAWANIPDSVWDQLEQPVPEPDATQSPQSSAGTIQELESDSESSRPYLADGEIEHAFWATSPAATAAPRFLDDSARFSLLWEPVPGLRVTWDDARLAEAARRDPDWQRALEMLALHSERIRHESGDDLA